jgi:hypothetical protein
VAKAAKKWRSLSDLKVRPPKERSQERSPAARSPGSGPPLRNGKSRSLTPLAVGSHRTELGWNIATVPPLHRRAGTTQSLNAARDKAAHEGTARKKRRERVRSRNGIRDAKGADDSAELASLQVGEDGDVEF